MSSISIAQSSLAAAKEALRRARDAFLQADYKDFSSKKYDYEAAQEAYSKAEAAVDKLAKALRKDADVSLGSEVAATLGDTLFSNDHNFAPGLATAQSVKRAAEAAMFGNMAISNLDNLLDPATPSTGSDYIPYSDQGEFSNHNAGEDASFCNLSELQEYIPYENDGTSSSKTLNDQDQMLGVYTPYSEEVKEISISSNNQTRTWLQNNNSHAVTEAVRQKHLAELQRQKLMQQQQQADAEHQRRLMEKQQRAELQKQVERDKQKREAAELQRKIALGDQRLEELKQQREQRERANEQKRAEQQKKISPITFPKEYCCETLLRKEMLRVGLKVVSPNHPNDLGKVVRIVQLNPTLYVEVDWGEHSDRAKTYVVRGDGKVSVGDEYLYIYNK